MTCTGVSATSLCLGSPPSRRVPEPLELEEPLGEATELEEPTELEAVSFVGEGCAMHPPSFDAFTIVFFSVR